MKNQHAGSGNTYEVYRVEPMVFRFMSNILFITLAILLQKGQWKGVPGEQLFVSSFKEYPKNISHRRRRRRFGEVGHSTFILLSIYKVGKNTSITYRPIT